MKDLSIEMTSNESVLRLKQRICELENIQPDLQRVLVVGQLLADRVRLSLALSSRNCLTSFSSHRCLSDAPGRGSCTAKQRSGASARQGTRIGAFFLPFFPSMPARLSGARSTFSVFLLCPFCHGIFLRTFLLPISAEYLFRSRFISAKILRVQ